MKIKVLAMAVLGLTLSCTAQTNKKMSDAYAMAVIPEPAEGQEVAVLASGCFWGNRILLTKSTWRYGNDLRLYWWCGEKSYLPRSVYQTHRTL